MIILVLSDSHSTLRIMREAVDKINPDAIVHLGDFYEDGEVLRQEYPQRNIYLVPGNCDRYRMEHIQPETLCCKVCGVKLYMTHGHNHYVKSSIHHLMADARLEGAAAALYGHTHDPYCRLHDDLWVMNPGSCGNGGGTVGIIRVEDCRILYCKVLRPEQWEENI